jgi:cell division protein FtsZ
LINLDFADVETIMKNMGEAIMGSGVAGGEERAVLAAQQAISSPLLDNSSISGAQGVLVNITGGPDLALMEVDEATSIIFEEAGNDANIIFGAVIDPKMTDEIRVTVIATGFSHKAPKNVEEEENEVIVRPKQKQARILAEQENVPLFNQKIVEEQEPVQPGITQPPASKFQFDDTVIYGDELDVPAFIRRQQE